MRSGVGAFCPRSRRLECLLERFALAALPAEAREGFDGALFGFAGRDPANTPLPLANSSAKVTRIVARTFIQPRYRSLQAVTRLAIELLLAVRRYHAGQKYRHGAVAIAVPQHLEDHRGPGLQLAYRPLVVFHRTHRLVIDFCDHVATVELELVREASWIDFRHQHASLPVHAH